MAAGGDAVARAEDGKVVFVRGALPGEVVAARIVVDKRDFAKAVAVEVVEPSADRIEAPCPAARRGCGGCTWQHIALEAQRRFKEQIVADALRRQGRIADPPVTGTVELEPWGFRTTIRVVAGPGGTGGYRRLNSHDIVEPERCLIAHPLVEGVRAVPGVEPGTEFQIRAGVSEGEVGSTVTEVVGGRRWRVSPRSFFQTRPDGAEALVALVAAAADELPGPPGDAVDLYAGVGLFAGVLAGAGWTVVAVEENEAAVADAEFNLADVAGRVLLVGSTVAEWTPQAADLVVADPGRPGLAKPGTAAVVACEPDRVVLVSCDAASLGRDAALLVGAGYRLDRSTLVDLFPHTPHVEVVSVFDRERSQ